MTTRYDRRHHMAGLPPLRYTHPPSESGTYSIDADGWDNWPNQERDHEPDDNRQPLPTV